jgi:uncharacterized protein (DUF433 family)
LNPRYCHWCQETRAEWYVHASHDLVCSPRCSKRKHGWHYSFLRLVDPHRGQGTLYITPDEYDDMLDAAADAILQEYHPHLLRITSGASTTTPAGTSARTQSHQDLSPAPLADVAALPKGIAKTPDFCEGSARIEGTNVPVWMVVDAQLRGAAPDDMERYWGITTSQIERALEYWDDHAEEIERELHRQEGV